MVQEPTRTVTADRPRRAGSARRLLVVMLGLALLTGGSAAAHADDLSDLTSRLAKARAAAKSTTSDLADVAEALESSDAELTKAYTKLSKTQAQLPVAQAEADKAQAEYQVAQREAGAVADRLTTARAETETLTKTISDNEDKTTAARNGVAEMARQLAKGDYGMTGVQLLVGAQSLDDIITEYNLSQAALRTESGTLLTLREANAIATSTQVRLQAAQASVADLKVKADALVQTTATAKKTADEAQAALTQLEADQKDAAAKIEERKAAEEAKQAELVAQNKDLRSNIQKLIGLTKKERKRLAAEQAAKEKAEREAAEKSGGSSGDSSSTADTERGSGYLSYPVKSVVITSPYGWRFHPVLHYWRLHAGTDFRAYCGTPIYAAAPGKVEWAKMLAGFGNQVMVNHGTVDGVNLMTSYNHLTRFAVSTGEHVKRGQLVGYSGETGTVTACHLHFEVYKNGVTVNPMTML